MEQKDNLQKKYGFITTTCLIVGAVIGSGIFFINETIFGRVGGDLHIAVIAWLVGGAIMFVMMWVWGKLAVEKDGMGGLMEYSDGLLGKTYSYFLGWFLGTILYPTFVAVLAWVTARFTAQLLGWEMAFGGGPTWMLAGIYMIAIYLISVLSPKLAGLFQVSTTVVKVIPLILMGVIGIIIGLVSGTTSENLTFIVSPDSPLFVSNPLFYAITATAFAYAGSEEVLMMSSEIRDRKKNLPKAIILGAIIIISIYVLYTVGKFGAVEAETLSAVGGVNAAFQNLFGQDGGRFLMVFIIISCLGAMNSAMMAGSRAFYALAIRDKGPAPDYVKQVDAKTNMPPTSAAISLLFCAIMFFFIFGNMSDMAGYPYHYHRRWFGDINFALSSLAPISLMVMYVPVFIAVMLKKNDWDLFNRFIMPGLSIAGALSLIYMVFYNNRYRFEDGSYAPLWYAPAVWLYILFFGVIMGIAAFFLFFTFVIDPKAFPWIRITLRKPERDTHSDIIAK